MLADYTSPVQAAERRHSKKGFVMELSREAKTENNKEYMEKEYGEGFKSRGTHVE